MIVDPEFKSFIPPLSDAEIEALTASILTAGRALDPLIVGEVDGQEMVLLDGHNRFEICTRLGLPYTTQSIGEFTRGEAKAWIFEHQVARRNLSTDQVLALAAARGVSAPANVGTARLRSMAADLAENDPAALARVISTGMLAMRWGAWARKAGKLPPRPPRAPRGPDTNIPEGHELRGKSTLTGPGGEIKAIWDKTGLAGNDAAEPIPADFAAKKISIMTGADGAERVRWASYDRAKADQWESFKRAMKDELEQYRGAALAINVPAPEETWRDYLSCYWWGDPHIGMLAHASETLGGHYDLKIAEAQLIECFRQLVWRTPPSRVGRIVNLGDFYHAETNSQVTPGHGHKLDVDGRSYKVQKVGMRILRAVIDLAKQRHEIVEFVAMPGNHDPNMAFQIAAWLQALYEGDPRVAIDDSIAAYSYREFGENLIATCHGDGAKEKDLPLLLAARQRQAWGRTRYHQVHAGHIHHTRKIEHSGCVTWYHNTLADKDAWHAFKGYDSEQFLESSTYHERFGPEGSTQVGIERVRAALAVTSSAVSA